MPRQRLYGETARWFRVVGIRIEAGFDALIGWQGAKRSPVPTAGTPGGTAAGSGELIGAAGPAPVPDIALTDKETRASIVEALASWIRWSVA
jgi:hypothetical protein